MFVYSMLILSATGSVMAMLKPDRGSVIAGALAFYLVCTAMMTVRTTVKESRPLLVCLMCGGSAVAIAGTYLGLAALSTPAGRLDGKPAALFFIFGTVAAIASALDARILRSGNVVGAHRLARHLWRMGFAMFLATSSFFLGQAKVFPEQLRIPAILAVPVLVVVAFTLYWLVRVLRQRRVT